MRACLMYLLRVVEVLQPVQIPLFPVRHDVPVVVFTDASYKQSMATGELAWPGGKT